MNDDSSESFPAGWEPRTLVPYKCRACHHRWSVLWPKGEEPSSSELIKPSNPTACPQCGSRAGFVYVDLGPP